MVCRVSDPRIIIAMDYSDMAMVLDLADRLDPGQCRLKVGKELFTRHGPHIVEELVRSGFSVFLDLKFHDIPNTVAQACKAAADLGVWMVNIHASGGKRMLLAAREAIDKSDHKPLLIAVTVLTSFTESELEETGIHGTIENQVLRLAGLSRESGIDGVVCSAQEAAVIRREIESPFCLVTPGIRPAGSPANDQKRVVTPAEAIAAGSQYLVIGRPITRASEPMKVLEQLNLEVNTALGTNP